MTIESTPPLTPLLLRAAEAAAGAQQYPKGALYLVATPIGNLADITLRAIHLLALVDHVACEDTRHSGALLRHLGLRKPLIALHEHNESEAARRVCESLMRGERVAYISDAGTPAVSDPGAALVAAARRAGHRVLPLPGPCSATAALSVAGDAVGEGFRFVGFLPAKGAQRQTALTRTAADEATQVLFEGPHRIESLAADLARLAPARMLTVCRELTKQFESVHTLIAADWPAWLAADPHQCRGEFVLVMHALATLAPETEGPVSANALATLRVLLAELPLKQAVGLTAQLSGESRNALYAVALNLRAAEE